MEQQHLAPLFIANGTLNQAVKKFVIPASVEPEVYLHGSMEKVQEKCIDFRYSVELNIGIAVTLSHDRRQNPEIDHDYSFIHEQYPLYNRFQSIPMAAKIFKSQIYKKSGVFLKASPYIFYIVHYK